MTNAAGLTKTSFWSKIMPWLWRRVFPYYVPRFVRDPLQRKLAAVHVILRARTRGFDAEAWGYLGRALGRIAPIEGFGSFIEILQYELDIAGVGFPVRSSASGVVRCGRGLGGYVPIEKIGRPLGEIDARLEHARLAQTRAVIDAAVTPFIASVRTASDAARDAAYVAATALEMRTRSVADAVRKVRAVMHDGDASAVASQAARSTIADALATLAGPQDDVRRLLDDGAVTEAWRNLEERAARAGLYVAEVRARIEPLRLWDLTTVQEHAEKRDLVQRLDQDLLLARQLEMGGE